MATMTISLPDDMKAFVEAQAITRGFDTAGECMRSLIREAQERAARRGQVDALLLEGLDSGPAAPMTGGDWEAIRREVERQQDARQGRTHAPEDAPHR